MLCGGETLCSCCAVLLGGFGAQAIGKGVDRRHIVMILMRNHVINGKTREECNAVITKMAEAGVATNVHYKPLPLLTAYKNLGFDIKDYPNAYALFENEITLPLHTKLTDEDVEYVIETFRKCVSEV